MTMKTKLHITLIALLGVLTACSDDILMQTATNGNTGTDGYYFVLGDADGQTRAVNYESDNLSVFSAGDVLGVFATNGNGELYSTADDGKAVANVQYKVKNITGGQVLEPVDDSNVLPESADITYIFYYPYNSTYTLNDIKSLYYEVKANQTPAETDGEKQNSNYEQSDLLWDVTKQADDNKVHINMDHVMANIILKIDNSLLKEGSTVIIPSTQLNIKGATLHLRSESEYFTYSTPDQYNEPKLETGDVTMWNYGTDEQGITTFRAAIPAERTLSTATDFFKITNANGIEKKYALSEELKLIHGKNYIFQVKKGSDYPVPVPSDDDSWVLDVKDKDGNIVGLLCREYLRYQPSDMEDKKTGTEYGKSKCINS